MTLTISRVLPKIVLTAGFFGLAATQSQAQDFNPEEYFSGKTIQLIVPSNAGGGADVERAFSPTLPSASISPEAPGSRS